MTDQEFDTGGRMDPPRSGVAVRMYQLGGLGDCFLLAFRADDGGARYMLIDCGMLSNGPEAVERLKTVVRSVAEATGGHLQVFVATHEHWDHVSGLHHARSIFDELTIDEVWLAWTEDPHDLLAKRLAEKYAQALQALSDASARLTAMGDRQAVALAEVLSFHGGLEATSKIRRAAQAIAYIRDEKEGVVPRFLRPGEPPLRIPDVPCSRIYVLGPPRNEMLLSRSNPSQKHDEAYKNTISLSEPAAFYAAVLAATKASGSAGEAEMFERSQPFERYRSISMKDAEAEPFFCTHYGFGADDEGPAWQRIEPDWWAMAEELALHLDDDTNNTSLVLAIEIESDKSVLLFAGDAQAGNWLSWHDVTFANENGASGQPITGTDLLRRTVLYKVGHHGSHNATLREKGLEMMQNPELVAMLPVDEDQAKVKGWAMPFPPLLERLNQKTRGRVIRADSGLPQKPESVPAAEWKEFLVNAGQKEGLWVEYRVIG